MKRRKTLKRLVLAVVLLSGLHVAACYVAGYITQGVFERGASSTVTLENPRIRYFPLRASVDNVHIYHPDEGPDAGFWAGRVEVTLDVLALLKKRIVLTKLHLSDSVVDSIGTNTGFIKTLEFVLHKPDKPKTKSTKWHDFLTANWRGWVKEVVVETKPHSATRLVAIGTEDIRAEATSVTFRSLDRFPRPGQPVEMSIEGSALGLAIKDSPLLPLGAFVANGKIQNGVLTVDSARVWDAAASDESRTSLSTGSGTLHFKEREEYNFSISGTLYDEYAAKLAFPVSDTLKAAGPEARYTLDLRGPLDKPLTSGTISVGFSKGADLFLRESCAIRKASANYAVSVDDLKVTELAIEDIIQGASFTLEFEESLPFRAAMEMVLQSDSPYVERCIPSVGIRDGFREKLTPFSQAVHRALANSYTKLSAQGSLATQEIQGTIDSQVYQRSSYASSVFHSDIRFDGSTIAITASEKGTVPRIVGVNRAGNSNDETRFKLRQRSSASLDAVYDFRTAQLNVEKLHLTDYPADRIAARIAPFISRDIYERIATALSPESEISGEFAGTTGKLSQNARGQATVTRLTLGPLIVDSLTVPIVFAKDSVRSQGLHAVTPGGAITANLEFNAKGEIAGLVEASGLDWRSFNQGVDLLKELQTKVSLTTDIAGTFSAPTLRGTLAAVSLYQGSETLTTNVKIATRENAIILEGALLEDRADIEVTWPLTKTGTLNYNATFNDFPLPNMGTHTSGEQRREGSLTAELRYQGAKHSPLNGSGSLTVSELFWPDARIEVGNAAPLHISIRDGALHFDEVRLRIGDKQLDVKGEVSHERGWNARLQGDWELESLSAIVQPLEQVAGNLRVELQVTGMASEPELHGEVELNQGSLSFLLANSIVGVSSAHGLMRFNGQQVRLEQFLGSVGDGSISAKGRASQILDPERREVRLAVQIEDGRVEPVEDLPVQFDARIGASQNGSEPFEISGDIEIAEARYERRFELDEVLSALTSAVLGLDAAKVQGSASGREEVPIRFDLVATAPNGLLIETELGSGELRGTVHVRGPAEAIELDGKVEVLTGIFTLGLNEFDILSGSLQFSPQSGIAYDPTISIVAETNIETASGEVHVVRMSIDGTLSAPKVHFSSDSGLDENEIVALFGFGGRGLNLISVKRDVTFTELLDPTSDISFRERLVGLTGFRDIHIESGLSEDTGEFVPSVRASRPLIGQSKLELTSELSGEQVSEAEIQYPLTNKLDATLGWRSRAVTDDVNASSGSYGIGLRFRKSFLGDGLFPFPRSEERP